LQIFADRIVATDDKGIPSGAFQPVAGTPFDFRQPMTVGARMVEPAVGGRGYNHSWLLPDRGGDIVRLAARLSDPKSGRAMDVLTSEPSVHAYVAGYFSGKDKGAEGRIYRPHDGIALEAQHLSNAPNDRRLPSTLLRAGEVYRSTTIYRFTAEKGQE
jgi:aldose 1-epimerase